MELKDETVAELTKAIDSLSSELLKMEITIIVALLVCVGFMVLLIRYYENRTNDRADGFSTSKAERLDDAGDTQGLIKYCEKWFKKYPNDVNINFYLGLAYYHDGQLEKAKHYFESTITLNPNYKEHVAAFLEEINDAYHGRNSGESNS
jgi:tetratricopeptide (TPR) repeat protein